MMVVKTKLMRERYVQVVQIPW